MKKTPYFQRTDRKKMSKNEQLSTVMVLIGLLFIFDKPISAILGIG